VFPHLFFFLSLNDFTKSPGWKVHLSFECSPRAVRSTSMNDTALTLSRLPVRLRLTYAGFRHLVFLRRLVFNSTPPSTSVVPLPRLTIGHHGCMKLRGRGRVALLTRRREFASITMALRLQATPPESIQASRLRGAQMFWCSRIQWGFLGHSESDAATGGIKVHW
jgi:hypothetical protein